jgi:hypothetical protein
MTAQPTPGSQIVHKDIPDAQNVLCVTSKRFRLIPIDLVFILTRHNTT